MGTKGMLGAWMAGSLGLGLLVPAVLAGTGGSPPGALLAQGRGDLVALLVGVAVTDLAAIPLLARNMKADDPTGPAVRSMALHSLAVGPALVSCALTAAAGAGGGQGGPPVDGVNLLLTVLSLAGHALAARYSQDDSAPPQGGR